MSIGRARALAIVAMLVACAVVLVMFAVRRDSQTRQSYHVSSCNPGDIPVVTRPLPKPEQIKVNVYNGTSTPNLATQVATDFRNHKITVGKVGDAPALYAGVAELRYGPKTLAAADVLQAYFLGQADFDNGFDIKRTDSAVDVIIGTQYQQLATPTEFNQAIAALGNPTPPPGTCDARGT
jgi:hypothetical protein